MLRGGAGADTLSGGAGKDYLSGGGGGDRFIFIAVTDSAAGSQRDVIAELGNGDLIDLSAIDANSTTGGNQAFVFIGAQGFHNVAGELRAVINGGFTVVSGDVDGDGSADFQIGIAGARGRCGRLPGLISFSPCGRRWREAPDEGSLMPLRRCTRGLSESPRDPSPPGSAGAPDPRRLTPATDARRVRC